VVAAAARPIVRRSIHQSCAGGSRQLARRLKAILRLLRERPRDDRVERGRELRPPL
jgi:hypothetical protein